MGSGLATGGASGGGAGGGGVGMETAGGAGLGGTPQAAMMAPSTTTAAALSRRQGIVKSGLRFMGCLRMEQVYWIDALQCRQRRTDGLCLKNSGLWFLIGSKR